MPEQAQAMSTLRNLYLIVHEGILVRAPSETFDTCYFLYQQSFSTKTAAR